MDFEKIKSFMLKSLVMLINFGLVGGGAAYIKNQNDKKVAAELELANSEQQQDAMQTASKAQELDQIIQNNAEQKNGSIANNPSQVTVQQPKTVTQKVSGGATTVKAAVPAPSKTTKKS